MERTYFKEVILSKPLEFPRQFYLMNKYKPAESYSVVIDQTEEDDITIREIEQRLFKHIGAIQITDTYSTSNVDPDEAFSYYMDLFPLYFIPKTEIELKFDKSFRSDPSSTAIEVLKIQLANRFNGAWLYKEVSEKIKVDVTKFYLILKQKDQHVRLSRNNPDIQLEYQEGDTILVKPLGYGSIPIILKLSGSNEVPVKIVKIEQKTTVEELKEIIDIEHKIPSETIKLIFNGDLLNDSKVLSEAGVKEGSSISLFKTTQTIPECGGGLKFVDPERSKETMIQFSKVAKEWRAATSGLCLEGICKNKECVAFGNYVIINKGIGIFDLVRSRLLNKCPMPKCQKVVEFETCGFNNCTFEFKGKRFEEGNLVPVEVTKEVGNQYLRYNPVEGSVVEWAVLKIITRKLGEKRNHCQICLEPVTADVYKLPCEHNLHGRCRNPDITCIVCRSNNSSMA